jgi:rhamnosyltransferase
VTTPGTSVVIRCYNEERHIGRLLSGLVRQTQPPDQIILVDSGSTDATLAIASQFPVEVATIEPQRFSFGRSLNVGCSAALHEILVFASAHVYPVYDSWLADLTAPLSDPQVVLAYGRQLGDERTRYSEQRVMARWFPPQSDTRQLHPFCNNANAAVRHSAWLQQSYDEDLTGLEDLDWAKRAQERGLSIAYVAEAPVVHAHDETWRQIVNRYRREAIAHKQIYHEQRMGPLDAIRLAVGNVASDYVHAAHDRALFRNLGSIPSFRAAQFWGTYRGFRQRGKASAVLRRHFYYPHGWGRQEGVAAPPHAKPIDYGDINHGEADGRAD